MKLLVGYKILEANLSKLSWVVQVPKIRDLLDSDKEEEKISAGSFETSNTCKLKKVKF